MLYVDRGQLLGYCFMTGGLSQQGHAGLQVQWRPPQCLTLCVLRRPIKYDGLNKKLLK